MSRNSSTVAKVMVDAQAGIESRYVAEQAVDRHAEHAPFEIPERDVDDAEQPDRELLGSVELPKPVPQPLTAVGTLADELLAEDPIDDVGEHRAAPFMVGLAHRAVVGRDPEHCRRPFGVRPAKTPPPGVRRGHGGEFDQVSFDGRDLHRGRSSYE